MIRINRHRFHRLERSGLFLPIEAADLSAIPFNVPYFKLLIRDRQEVFKQAKAEGKTNDQYVQDILKDYIARGWLRHKRGKDVPDTFKLLRAYEDRYKDRQPQYESPWEKKPRHFKDFQTKIARTIDRQAQRSARGYN